MQRNVTKLDRWLWNLHKEHPMRLWLLAIAIGGALFIPLAILECLVTR